MTRSIPAVLVLLSLTLGGDALARSRAVRSAVFCTYGIVPSFATTASHEGLSRARVDVVGVPLPGTTGGCTSWNAWSLTSWITVTGEGNVAYVDMAPNPTSTARTGTVLIAGVRLDLHQDGAPVISPPIAGNVLQNGGFDRALSPWGWQSRFPNGPGSASWSSMDARGNPNSGSIRLINTRPAEQGHTFQQLQCVDVDAGEIYEYGGSFFATSATAVRAVFAIVEYADAGCDVAAVSSESQQAQSRAPGSWQTESYTKRMGATTRSAFVVIGNLARTAGTYEIFVDDVFLKKR